MPGTAMVEDDPNNHNPINNFQMIVLQATGDATVIEQLQLCQAVKNLGLFTPLEGGLGPSFSSMRDRVDKWATKLRNGHLPRQSVLSRDVPMCNLLQVKSQALPLHSYLPLYG